MFEPYENVPIVVYSPTYEGTCPAFYRICPKCGRYVKPDKSTQIPEYLKNKANATCAHCGRVQMPFYDWISYDD